MIALTATPSSLGFNVNVALPGLPAAFRECRFAGFDGDVGEIDFDVGARLRERRLDAHRHRAV